MSSIAGLPMVKARDASRKFADAVSRVQFAGVRVALTRRGIVVAGLVSADDLLRLQQLDDGGCSAGEWLDLVSKSMGAAPPRPSASEER